MRVFLRDIDENGQPVMVEMGASSLTLKQIVADGGLIQKGTVLTPAMPMGSGANINVTFPTPFSEVPTIIVEFLTGGSGAGNTMLTALDRTVNGFRLNLYNFGVSPSGSNLVAGIEIMWTAIAGAVVNMPSNPNAAINGRYSTVELRTAQNIPTFTLPAGTGNTDTYVDTLDIPQDGMLRFVMEYPQPVAEPEFVGYLCSYNFYSSSWNEILNFHWILLNVNGDRQHTYSACIPVSAGARIGLKLRRYNPASAYTFTPGWYRATLQVGRA